MDERTDWQKRIGVGEKINALPSAEARSETRRRNVIVDRGPRAGKIGGFQTDHASGRQDATVFAPTATVRTKITED